MNALPFLPQIKNWQWREFVKFSFFFILPSFPPFFKNIELWEWRLFCSFKYAKTWHEHCEWMMLGQNITHSPSPSSPLLQCQVDFSLQNEWQWNWRWGVGELKSWGISFQSIKKNDFEKRGSAAIDQKAQQI